jgi:hypothetical protein
MHGECYVWFTTRACIARSCIMHSCVDLPSELSLKGIRRKVFRERSLPVKFPPAISAGFMIFSRRFYIRVRYFPAGHRVSHHKFMKRDSLFQ